MNIVNIAIKRVKEKVKIMYDGGTDTYCTRPN